MSKKAQNPKPKTINSIALTGPKIVQEKPNIASPPVAQPQAQVQQPSTNIARASNPTQHVQRSYNANSLHLPSPPRGQTERFDYHDPPVRLTEGVFKRIFQQHRIAPRDKMSEIFPPGAKRDLSLPHSHTERMNNFSYDDFRPAPLFPNTPFKQEAPISNQYVPAPRSLPPVQSQSARNSMNIYQNPNNASYAHGAPQHTGARYENNNNASYAHGAPQHTGARYENNNSAQRFAPQLDAIDREFESLLVNKRINTKPSETITPSLFRNSGRYASLEDSAKMRNPMYASHDFTDYQKNRGHNFRPQDYNYLSNEPVAPKEFIKSHASTIALAKRYDMEQQTKIHPQLGFLGVAPGERRATPILKPFANGTGNTYKVAPRDPATSRELNVMYFDPTRYELIEPIASGEPVQPIDPARYELIESTASREPARQNVEHARYEVTPLKSNVGYSVNPQPYQEARPQQFVPERQSYNSQPVPQTISSPSILKGINKQPVQIMPPPSLQTATIEKDYNKPYGQYAPNYKAPMSYPW